MTTLMEHETELDERLRPGTKVEVRKRFDSSWARGFEVADAVDDGYTIRRMSDGHLLPASFAHDDVRRERKRGMWWY
jgi:hypothetical protein